ncbi:arginine-tRNA-protein transferase [Hypoxylon trugodes]|uniref:arginine-tRNA-protein transferase n=1 Tax=Hypoxylon trugodes TaxID=326681 RepID=UPI0021908821|nr:arginine-tRNA-protein transferase [Hypoxylon trugodes]KAI1388872.1 arginine-tRNA-protein transferase [Hypoxylon trugodes]
MQATPENAFLYITPIGYRQSISCGYCRRKGTSHSYYARAISMSPAMYETLVDRCWRRSGTLLYRPNQLDSCCPHYTIRLDSDRFRPSKDQRQAINRFNKYVIGEEYAKEAARLYPKSREQARKRDTEFDLVERIHESDSSSLKQPPEPSHTFTVTLESNKFTEEKYLVFENYQRLVHHESPSSITREGFKRFLCTSPLTPEKFTAPDGRERQLGSFHQCYRLDGKLVAIGVLDLLPQSVSAVYFLYHESIHRFSPGKLGALREIALAIEGGYRWWYPGFYIHTCPKMRYKMDFSPQQVLDPETLKWVDLDQDTIAKFDSHGYLDFKGTGEYALRNPSPKGENSKMDVDGQKDDSEEDAERHKDPSLFHTGMPGIPSAEEMSLVNLDDIKIRFLDRYSFADTIFSWKGEDITDPGGAKALVAELVAAIGLDLIPDICLDFRRQSSDPAE